jgi:hypothetical protein
MERSFVRCEKKERTNVFFFSFSFPMNVLYSRTAAPSLCVEGVGRCGQLHGGNEQRVVAARLGFIISCAAAIIHQQSPAVQKKERKEKKRKKEERGAVNETHIRIELKQFQ